MLKEITAKMLTPAARREAAAHLEDLFEVSQRRACDVLGVDRTMMRYRSQRDGDVSIRKRARALAVARRLRSRNDAISAGRSTSCRMRLRVAAGSGSLPWSMTSAVSVSGSSPTTRSRACGRCANSTGRSPNGHARRWRSATTAPS